MGLETVELLMDLEDYFHIRVPDEAASNALTVADLQAVIVGLLVQKGRTNSEETRREVWDGMMHVLEQEGYDVKQIRPDSKWIGDITQYG